MTAWTVTCDDRTEIILACTYTEAAAIARVRACRGRAPYKTRALALAAGTGPVYPCGADHWHAAPDLEQSPPPTVATNRK
jgi:hypothetical protein